MTGKRKQLRRRQLDRQLQRIGRLLPATKPSTGWINSVREALGMSLQSFAQRMGNVSRSTAYQLEKAEVNETISLKRLRLAADVLGCDMQIVFIPKTSLTQFATDQAMKKARNQVEKLNYSMAMENQEVSKAEIDLLVKDTAYELLNRGDSSLWE